MAIDMWSVAAATAVVGYDLCTGQDVASQGYDRAITGFGLTGSAAAGDTIVDLFIDDVKIGTYTNTLTGVGAPGDHVQPVEPRAIPSNSKLKVKVVDAPATNPIWVYVETERLE